MSKHKNQNREILVHLPHTALDRHSRNMRRSYAPEDVRRMAVNQADRAKRGLDPCVHPLIVTPGPRQWYNPKRHKRLTIVAGHLRHAGNSWLGNDAPLLNCIVRFYADEQAMQADMSTENGIRADISPLDWAHHLQAQMAEGKTAKQLARDSGKSMFWINEHLALLELGQGAQALIDRGELPMSAAEHLSKIGDKRTQDQMARRLAKRRATTTQIAVAVTTHLQIVQGRPKPKAGAITKKSGGAKPKAMQGTTIEGLASDAPATLKDLRDSAAFECSQCGIGNRLPVNELAWHIALTAAGETCDCCNLRTVQDACAGCPLAAALSRIARSYAKAK
jgi:ParB/RepB/Spo0J family partition protein